MATHQNETALKTNEPQKREQQGDDRQQAGFMPGALNPESNKEQAQQTAEEEQKRKESLTERD